MKDLFVVNLFEIYGSLLTEKQREYVNMYYLCDLSLAEISQNFNISRQSVKDGLNKSVKILYGFEEKLKLFNKFEKLSKLENRKEIEEILF